MNLSSSIQNNIITYYFVLGQSFLSTLVSECYFSDVNTSASSETLFNPTGTGELTISKKLASNLKHKTFQTFIYRYDTCSERTVKALLNYSKHSSLIYYKQLRLI